MASVTEQKEGIIFDIQRCSMYDGPGIRTTIFLKGCPLSCRWCHNPESQNPEPELAYFLEKSTRQNPSAGQKKYGWYTDVDTLIECVQKDRSYFLATGGGLTVSGGEPFYQPGFLYTLLKRAKQENISTCIETSGFVSQAVLTELMPYIDIFLFDYKESSARLHKTFTGVNQELILSNLDYLYHNNKDIILRCPIIPSFNDTAEHFTGIAQMEKKYPNLKGIEILPYHDMGNAKAAALGRKDYLTAPSADAKLKAKWKEQMKLCGCCDNIRNSF